VRVADPKFRQIVPMRYFNLILSPAEVEAFTADYLEQTGPRADAARMRIRVVAVTARLTTELEELKRSQNSPSLWRLHADASAVLIDMAERLADAVARLASFIGQPPQGTPIGESLDSSLETLRERALEATRLIVAAREFASD
jgi:hypothetical protein